MATAADDGLVRRNPCRLKGASAEKSPEYQVRENVESVVAALADPERTPEQNHQGWYERLIADGWRHGPIKDEAAKTHPDLVPFDQLPEHEKQKDRLFMAIVRALAPEVPGST
jgi:RyR domain